MALKDHHKYYPVCSESSCKEVRYNIIEKKYILFRCTACGNSTTHNLDSIPTSDLKSLLEDVLSYKQEMSS